MCETSAMDRFVIWLEDEITLYGHLQKFSDFLSDYQDFSDGQELDEEELIRETAWKVSLFLTYLLEMAISEPDAIDLEALWRKVL